MAVVGAGSVRQRITFVCFTSCLTPIWLPSSTPNSERAAEAAGRLGCRVVAGVPQLRDMVDAAIVAAPTSVHADIGCELLEMGIDVLVEKPIAGDLASAERLIDTAEANGAGACRLDTSSASIRRCRH